MQALILAAGMGKRLGKYTHDRTKCMVQVNGKMIIERALDALVNANLKKIIIVIGYQAEKLRDFLGNQYKGVDITYVLNNIYDSTNNIHSLWLAREYLYDEDTILLESDIVFDEKIIIDILASPSKNLAVVAKFSSWMDGTVTVLDRQDTITDFIPKRLFDWTKIESYYKTVNIFKFTKEFLSLCYLPFMEAYIKTMGRNEFYENVLGVVNQIEDIQIKAHKLDEEKWYEIDCPQDLYIAETIFLDEQHKLERYQKSYGGYWRYDRLKDFCYLVNPYFPGEGFLSEIKANFATLLSQYPSGLNVLNLLAAQMFNCSEKEIVVGNGAAELIKAAAAFIKGKIGIAFPSFDEYANSFGEERVVKFEPRNDNFNYVIGDLKSLAEKVNCILLINPNNPTGQLINKKDILDLLGYLQSKGIILILDESFMDFAERSHENTMFHSEIMHRFENLIIIKSISKSYGVPGLRLGVLATSNQDILSGVIKNISIWNINSFGEYFMQIFHKYNQSYKIACDQIRKERKRFAESLAQVSFLRVIDSQANYLMCEVVSKYDSTELVTLLLNRYQVLIKDLKGKEGIGNQNYVRIAIRNSEDNNYLVKVLNEL